LQGSIYNGFTLADLDGDAKVEIIAGTSQKKLYVFHYDGTLKGGWPITVNEQITGIPAIGDINGDQVLDIVVSTRKNHLYALKHSGAMLLSLKEPNQANNYHISPILLDLNNDNKDEILLSTLSGYIYAYDQFGEYAMGFPLHIGDGSYATPAIGDIDRNGTFNIIHKGSDCKLYAWDLPTSKSNPGAHWYKVYGNSRNTCYYHEQEPTRNSTRIAESPLRPQRAFFSSPHPNPFYNEMIFRFYAGKRPNKAELKIYDVSGRLVKQLKIPTSYSLLPTELSWDGKNSSGNTIASGVYFAKLTIHKNDRKITFVRKLVRMKSK
jgi:hypothetical protein